MSSRRCTVALAAVGAMALLAGCGGGSSRLTKAQYEQRVQKDAAALTKATSGIGTSTSSFSDLQKVVTSAQSGIEAAAKDLESLKPPQEAENANKAFVAALRAIESDFKAMATALKKHDLTKIVALVQQLGGSKEVAAAKRAAADLAKKGYHLGAFSS